MNQNFENKTLEYDLEAYPWDIWVLEEIKKEFPSVTSLENIHNEIPEEEIFEVCIFVQDLFKTERWMRNLSRFAKRYISPLLDEDFLIKRQPTLNLVVPNQERLGRRLPFHQGIFYDNGRGQGTIWMPLTKSFGSNAMWIINTEESRQLTKKVIEEQWDVSTFEKHCMKLAYPVELDVGQAHLFNQESIHGNINNTTEVTRMALDWHVLPKGGEFHRRLPGGFFRHPDDYSSTKVEVASNNRVIGYVSNNHDLSIHWPKNFQRAIMDNYMQDRNLVNLGYQFENEFLDHLPILSHLFESQPNGIVLSSIYALPKDCEELLEKAVFNEVILYFANEHLTVKTFEDLDRVVMYRNWGVPKKGKYSWET